MPMSNEVITHKHEWVRGLFSELDRIAKDVATMADENQLPHLARLSQQWYFAVSPTGWENPLS